VLAGLGAGSNLFGVHVRGRRDVNGVNVGFEQLVDALGLCDVVLFGDLGIGLLIRIENYG
jgi:hypothetical protein